MQARGQVVELELYMEVTMRTFHFCGSILVKRKVETLKLFFKVTSCEESNKFFITHYITYLCRLILDLIKCHGKVL